MKPNLASGQAEATTTSTLILTLKRRGSSEAYLLELEGGEKGWNPERTKQSGRLRCGRRLH